jgi:HPr kinase/phosphorylase
MPYKVQSFLKKYQESLDLRIIAGKKGLGRKIAKPEVHRPGLSLSGYRKNRVTARIIVFGKVEIEYLKELDIPLRKDRIQFVITKKTPSIIIARNLKPPKELVQMCEEMDIPLFRSTLSATSLLSKITYHLLEEFAPSITLHGTLVEVFGVGIIIQGDSSVGKSEAALGLIERGHRLISDDIVKIKRKEDSYLEGSGPELTRHLMEIRGIGIINVAHLYGAVCVRPDKKVEIAIKLEKWDDSHFYDRVGLEERYCEILDIRIPFHVLPVKPGRDVVLLIETFALNYRLKEMGYHSAKEFNTKLLDVISRRKKVREAHLKDQSTQ